MIVPPDSFAHWLDPNVQEPDQLQPFLQPSPGRELALHAVTGAVGSVKNEGAALIEPVRLSG